MPRRNQQAEDEAYAQTLQDEYRKEFVNRQADRNKKKSKNSSSSSKNSRSSSKSGRSNSKSRSNSNSRSKSRSKSSGDKKKKKKKSGDGESSSSRSNNKQRRRSRSRSSSRDSQQQHQQKQRRPSNHRRSSTSDLMASSSADDSSSGGGGGRKNRRHSTSASSSSSASVDSSSGQVHDGGRSGGGSRSNASRSASRSRGGGRSNGSRSNGSSSASRSRSHHSRNRRGSSTAASRSSSRSRSHSSRRLNRHGDANGSGDASRSSSRSQSRSSRHLNRNGNGKASTDSSGSAYPPSAGDEWLSTYHPAPLKSPKRGNEHGYAHGQPTVVPIPMATATAIVIDSDDYDSDDNYIIHKSQTADDEQYARMVQLEEEQEQARRLTVLGYSNTPTRTTRRQPPSSSSSSSSKYHHHQHFMDGDDDYGDDDHEKMFSNRTTTSTSSGSTAPSTDDEAVARRIQQELQDAEYAQRMSLQEQQDMASEVVVQGLAHSPLVPPPDRSCSAKTCMCIKKFWLMTICLAIAVTVPLLFVFDVFDSSDIPFFGDLFGDDFVGNDPWSGNNMTIDLVNGTAVPRVPDNAYAWPINSNEGGGVGGLRLDILNACSDDWQPFVQTAIANWDNGRPIDSLTLFSSRIPYESECSTVTGKLKICNGDYGDTRWRGLNEVLLSPRQNTIVASTARLNEYYLKFENDYQKLYTCCHELGHGFGLPHWDEDFFNKDLGNCMDYTQNPETSSEPDESNFLYLAQLYGGREVAEEQAVNTVDSLESVVVQDPSVMALVEDQDYNNDYLDNNKNERDKKKEDKEDKNDRKLLLEQSKRDPRQQRTLRNSSNNISNNGNNRIPRRGLGRQQSNNEDIPLSNSRLALEEDGFLMLPGDSNNNNNNHNNNNNNDRQRQAQQQRRILQADENSEVHIFPSEEYPGLLVMQHYLLVREEETN